MLYTSTNLRASARLACYKRVVNGPADARPLTFARTRRLTRPAEFLRVKTEGTAHRGRLIILGVLETPGGGAFRAGFVTSKRIGNAVARNRVRRRMREAVRLQQHGMREGIWLVLIARPGAAQATFAELKHEWLRLAERASILAP